MKMFFCMHSAENQQVTGSFKARGAFNKLAIISSKEDPSVKKVVLASTGNHAMACVRYFEYMYMQCEICSFNESECPL